MVGAALVSVVEHPHVTHVHDLVLAVTKEFAEVLCGLSDLGKPDHSGQVSLTTLNVSALESDSVSVVDNVGPYHSQSTHTLVRQEQIDTGGCVKACDLLAKYLAGVLVMVNQDLRGVMVTCCCLCSIAFANMLIKSFDYKTNYII